MVEYGALRERKGLQTQIDPVEIFRRLPKSASIKDLFDIQRKALQEWFKRRSAKDIVIKLNTGGGKTLVGLLIAQSTMNEQHGPVLYLCPNWQLVDQTISKAAEVGIPTLRYDQQVDIPEFLNGQAVMVAPYQVLFNGKSKFGIRGRVRVTGVTAIVIDDAHAALPMMRQQFTLSVPKDQPIYSELVGTFRDDFAKIRKEGLFDDVVQGQEPSVIEVPYWSWKAKLNTVRQLLNKVVATDEKYEFTWPLLRDELDVCHALISSYDFSITPMYPMVDMFPTFAECPRRVYMSATLADDSAIIRTFDASPESVAQPIMPAEMTNVGERMILVPALIWSEPAKQLACAKKLARLVENAYKEKGAGVAILVPSYTAAEEWQDIGTVALREDVQRCVEELQSGRSKGPFIFANRYDGIDLPGDSCRLLILAGLPKGIDSYDRYLGSVLGESSSIQTTIAQRIEQGAGRSTRGAGDFSVVLFVGSDLAAWIGTSAHLNLLTQVTRAQFEIGVEISKAIASISSFEQTVLQCLNQDREWRAFHAEAIADLADSLPIDRTVLQIASTERKYFGLLRQRRFEQAARALEDLCDQDVLQDRKYIGWLLQLGARAAYFGGLDSKSRELQERAYGANSILLLPHDPRYVQLDAPGEQAEAIVRQVINYRPIKTYLSHFEQTANQLSATVSSNQFEEALKNLGITLGFRAQRPEADFRKGPDVLWLLDSHRALVIEAKSKKDPQKPLTKAEHGQLLESYEWFRSQYPHYEGVKVVVHPNVSADTAVTTGNTMVLTLDNLARVVSQTRRLLSELCSAGVYDETTLIKICEIKLTELKLKPADFCNSFLQPLQNIRR